MSRIRLRANARLTHRMILPMSNIVMPWTTIGDVIQRSRQDPATLVFYLRQQQSVGLQEPIHELVLPDHLLARGLFMIRVVDTVEALSREHADENMPGLQLDVRVYWSGRDLEQVGTTATVLFRAKGLDDEWYRFQRKLEYQKKLETSGRPRVRISAESQRIDAAVDRGRAALEALVPADTLESDAAFVQGLQCALNLPLDATLVYRPPLSLYDNVMRMEGPPVTFPSYPLFKKLMVASQARGELLQTPVERRTKSAMPYKAWRDTFRERDLDLLGRLQNVLLNRDIYVTDVPVYPTPREMKRDGKDKRSDDFVRQAYNSLILNASILGPDLVDLKTAQPRLKLQPVASEQATQRREADLVNEYIGTVSDDRRAVLNGPGLRTQDDREWVFSNLREWKGFDQLYGQGLRHEIYRHAFESLPRPFRYLFTEVLELLDVAIQDWLLRDTREQRQEWNRYLNTFIEGLAGNPRLAMDALSAHFPADRQDRTQRALSIAYRNLFPRCRHPLPIVEDVYGALTRRLRELQPAKYARVLRIRDTLVERVRDYMRQWDFDDEERRTAYARALYAVGRDATLVPNLSESRALDYLQRHEQSILPRGRRRAVVRRVPPRARDVFSDVAGFFGIDPVPAAPNRTLQLFMVLPVVDCLWDWVPTHAQLLTGEGERFRHGAQVWATYTRAGETTTVIWQRSLGLVQTREQNQVRLMVEPLIMQAFTFGDFEGFQTFQSLPTEDGGARTRDYTGITFLQRSGVKRDGTPYDPKPFNFLIDRQPADPAGVARWDPDLQIDSCAGTDAVVAAYRACQLSNETLEDILDVSFPAEQSENRPRRRNDIKVQLYRYPRCDAVGMLFNQRTAGFKLLSSNPTYGTPYCTWVGDGSGRPTFYWWMKWNSATSDRRFHPARYHEFLTRLQRTNVSLPVTDFRQTGENAQLRFLRFNIGDTPDVGDEYWTIAMMGDPIMTLRKLISCSAAFPIDPELIAFELMRIIRVLLDAEVTCGDLNCDSFVVSEFTPNDSVRLSLVRGGRCLSSLHTPYLDMYSLSNDITEWYTRERDGPTRRILTLIIAPLMGDRDLQRFMGDMGEPLAVFRQRYFDASDREEVLRLGTRWCEQQRIAAPEGAFLTMVEFQRAALRGALRAASRVALRDMPEQPAPDPGRRLADGGARVWRGPAYLGDDERRSDEARLYPNVALGVRPAFLNNIGASCYFNVVMLLLYQMPEILAPRLIDGEPVYALDCSQFPQLEGVADKVLFVDGLRTLQTRMGAADILAREQIGLLFELSKRAFPSGAGRQRDSAEFINKLLECNTMPEIISLRQTTTVKISNIDIEILKCPKRPRVNIVPLRARRTFAEDWDEMEAPRPSLDLWTYDRDSSTINIRTSNLQCPLERGEIDDVNEADRPRVDWDRAADLGRVIPPDNYNMFVIGGLPNRTREVCEQIQEVMDRNIAGISVAGHARANTDRDLFFKFTRETKKFDVPTSQYFLTHYSWDPEGERDVEGYMYGVQTLTFRDRGDEHVYDLVCVVHRTGRGRNIGHYFASLKTIDNEWYLYDDMREGGTRRRQATVSGRGPPMLLLFKKRS